MAWRAEERDQIARRSADSLGSPGDADKERVISNGDTTVRQIAKDEMISKLNSEIKWQWKWEKRNRKWNYYIKFSTWLCGVATFAVACLQLYHKGTTPEWSTMVLVVCSVLNMTLPVLASMQKYEERQRVHDWMAREYDVLKTKLAIDSITPEQAVKKFEQIHKVPVEKHLVK